jgi:NitT/TauT family transport system ATP-binding protein/sulfonate transport system ATP-binding protein
MTDCPSTVMEEVKIDMPHPRERTDQEFLHIRKEISAMVNRRR